MSSGVDLRVDRCLELLGRLKQSTAAFAQREDQMARELRAKRIAVERQVHDAVSADETSHAAKASTTEEYFRAQRARIESVFTKRRKRVEEYRSAQLRNLPRRVQEMKENFLGKLQMRNYQEQRKLTTNMGGSDATFTGFLSQLGVLRDLEKRAKRSFRGYGSLKRRLRVRGAVEPETEHSLESQLEVVRAHLTAAGAGLDEFDKFAVPRFFRILPLYALFFLLAVGAGFTAWSFGLDRRLNVIIGAAYGAIFIVLWFVHLLGLGKAKRLVALQLAAEIVAARRIIIANGISSPDFAVRRETNRKRLQEEYERGYAGVLQEWGRADEVAVDFERRTRNKLENQSARISGKIDRLLGPKLERIEADRVANIEWLNHEAATRHGQLTGTRDTALAALATEEKTRWDEIEADWQREITPLYQAIAEMNAEATVLSPPWNPALVENWTPPADFSPGTKFGQLLLDLAKQPGSLPKSPRLALPGPAQIALPAALSYPFQGSLLIETGDSGEAMVSDTLNNIMLRLLTSNPPGKVSFTIIDPVRLGQNFAGLMTLGDYQESIINRRIWTQRDQIEERLAELGEHIEKVIQMYLRNEYATITEYNRQAGSVAEKYQFLVIADFPAHFSETAVKRLQSIAASGPRCGIFTLLHWDKRQPPPDGLVPEDLRANSVCIQRVGNEFVLGQEQAKLGVTLNLEPPPEFALNLVHKIGQLSIDSNRVQVPFDRIAPKPDEMWLGDTTNELRVAIGRTGATKLQYLAIGKGTRQHALFAGKTGSGKSTLFHVIITNLALECSPDQVEFYLIDFKKGVEFKCYATKHLPHAKVVAIESDREFALSVLQRVDEELKRRGDLFRKLGVQDVAGYKKASGGKPMPRTLLMIDEFQEFFVEDDPVAQSASLLFDRIVRQGRAFGIHVLLGSQTLGGAYSLARATIGQMVIRVALQCNEADSYLIMDENNSAPRLLSRPGEGIYNDSAGAMEGNSPFQVVWLSDEERDEWLDRVRAMMTKHPEISYTSPIVFEGNAPSDIRDNELFRFALTTIPTTPPPAARCWLGAPNSIKGPTEAAFQRQSGNHMLIVGQREEASLTMMGLSLMALAAQYPPGAAKFVLFQSAPPGSVEGAFLDQIVQSAPDRIRAVHTNGVPAMMNELAAELQSRSAAESDGREAPIFLFIHGLHKFKKLRHEDDFSFSSGGGDAGPDPGAQFQKIVTEGSGYGIHIITSVDTLNSVNQFLNRKALSEFEMRVVFQMSANDSASLIDSPKASNLGLHRAYFYNEREGSLETFRPYALPESDWVAETLRKISTR